MKNYIVAASAIGIAASAFATVEAKLYADTYIVTDGGRTYSVLDIYVKGNHLGDTIGASVLGLSTHAVVFKTSLGTGTRDIFVHGGSAGNGWLPTDSAAKSWDSFIAAGNRSQGSNARITNRAGSLIDHGVTGNWTGASNFSQMSVAGSNFIDEGTASGWYSSKGGNAYSSAGAAENPFARVSLYNSDWNSTYGDLYRGTGNEILKSKGTMQAGVANATTAWSNWAGAAPTAASLGAKAGGVEVLEGSNNLGANGGASLDFHWMLGRFAIDVTGKSSSELITMNVQFSMVGKNGISAESGTLFSGGSSPNSPYRVSQFIAFAVPAPGAAALLGLAGLMRRRRSI